MQPRQPLRTGNQNDTISAMIKLRLVRMGRKNKPFYRIAAMNARSKRDGKALEYIGYYNPVTTPKEISLDLIKYAAWLEKGAQPTSTVQTLAKRVQTQ